MSTHYLVDAHIWPIAGARIIDVRHDVSQSSAVGNFVVRIPDGVDATSSTPAGQPALVDYASLITRKYTQLQNFYFGYTDIAYDDLDTTAGFNLATASGVQLGIRGNFKFQAGGTIDTVTVALAGAPVEAVVTWEAFTYTRTDQKSAIATYTYTEQAASGFTVLASFDNGANFNAVTDGVPFNIPMAHQGANLVLRFTNAAAAARFLGGWAVIY